MRYSMTNTDSHLDRIVLEFPENKTEITLLYNKSIDFIEICEDYIVCMNSIYELKNIENNECEKVNDLEVVSLELKEELLSKI